MVESRIFLGRKYNFQTWIADGFRTLIRDVGKIESLSQENKNLIGHDFLSILLAILRELDLFKSVRCASGITFCPSHDTYVGGCLGQMGWNLVWHGILSRECIANTRLSILDIPDFILGRELEMDGFNRLCHSCVIRTVDDLRSKMLHIKEEIEAIVEAGALHTITLGPVFGI